jgi:hypothetical protein
LKRRKVLATSRSAKVSSWAGLAGSRAIAQGEVISPAMAPNEEWSIDFKGLVSYG